MGRVLRHLVMAAILGGAGSATAATTIPRYLEFRDGSVLRLPVVDREWQVTVLRPEGGFETRAVRLSDLQGVRLTPTREFERRRPVFAAVEKLGSDDFQEREHGQRELLKMGPAVRPDLEVALDLLSDVEIQHRLRQVLLKWNAGPGQAAPAIPFDHFTAGETLWGDAGDGEITVQVEGQTRRLSRRELAGITERVPDPYPQGAPRPGPGSFRRVEEKEFPPGCLEEGFENAPDGHKLTAGENIEKLFIPRGFVLSTSIKESFVSVNNFLVNGKSGGQSVATHQPLYHGEITIRFVQPGRPDLPAGVTYFGCWMAVVLPRGTSLVAYDLQGRELGRIHTERGPHEFMAVRSAVPIHQVRIVPNLEIDPDYTLDDFIYSAPQPADVRHSEKFTVDLADGERVLCRVASFEGDGLRLQGLTADLPDCTRPLADLLRVTTPTGGKPEPPWPPGVFAELADGSVLFGSTTDRDAAPVFGRRPQLFKEPDNLVGLWKADVPRMAWPDKIPPPVVWDADKKSWQKVSDVKLAADGVRYTVEGGNAELRKYQDVDALFLKEPASPRAESWHVRTVQGEDIVLDAGEAAVPAGQLSRELTTVWQGKALKIPAAEVASVFHVPRGP